MRQNDPEAQLHMANLLFGNQKEILGDFPLVVYKSDEKARKLLMKSEALGNAEAMFNLAMLSLSVEIAFRRSQVSQDILVESIERLEKAASLGHIKAISYLARIAFESLDLEKSRTFYKKYQARTNQDCIDASSIFNDLEFQEIMDIYERAIMDDPVALMDLGWYFMKKGKYDHSKNSFLRSLDLGCQEVAYYLGEIYFQQQNSDIAKAKQMYLTAVAQVPEASLKLGQIALMEGEFEEAIKYYNLATQHGLPGALQITTDPVYEKLVELVSLDDPILKNINLGKIFYNEEARFDVLGYFKNSVVFKSISYDVHKAMQLWENGLQMLLSVDDTATFSSLCEKYNIIKICRTLHDQYINVPQFHNPQRAKELLELMEEKLEDGDSAYLLAKAHSEVPNNLGIAVLNPDLASSYLHKAAARNHLRALNLLTTAYVEGEAKFNILADNFVALKYATLSFKHLPVYQRNIPQNIMFYKSVLSNIFISGNSRNVSEMTDEQRQTLNSFVTGERSDLVNLKNIQDAYLYFSGLFTDKNLKKSFNLCPAVTELCLSIADGSGDLQKLMSAFHENIDKPGFVVGCMKPKNQEISDKLRGNLDYFPVDKTQFFFDYKDIVGDLQKIDKLVFNLWIFGKCNNYVLNLLEQYGNRDTATIQLVLEVLSLNTAELGLYRYAKAVIETVFMNDHMTWPQDERLEWAKTTLKDMQEYCSADVVTLTKESVESFNKIMRDTISHRNKKFKEANPFLPI